MASQGPDFTRSPHCPSCGSPAKTDQSGACAHCGNVVKPGEFAWELSAIRETDRRPRVNMPLSLGGAEIGTDLPTLFDSRLDAERKAFALADPDFSWDRFQKRVQETFFALQKAWSEKSWETARPYETDRLFQTHLFWMERYRTQGYTNRLENINFIRAEMVKVARDPYFDLITIRLWAEMIDYTADVNGKLIAGDKKKTRKFTEYWTFIRKAGFQPKTPATDDASSGEKCPNCAAPLKVFMNGQCEYCGANIASGDFDWTLAKIDQDEVYRG